MLRQEQNKQMPQFNPSCIAYKWNNTLYVCVLQTFRTYGRGGYGSLPLWAPVTPHHLLFLCQVILLFETEHQFKQEAIIAQAIGAQKGPEAVRAPPAMKLLVKTRPRQ